MDLYDEGCRYLAQGASQVGVCTNEAWSFLLAAQVCLNQAVQLDPDAAVYYARAEALEWMFLLSKDKDFVSPLLKDLNQVIEQEKYATRPLLLLNALWKRSHVLEPINSPLAIADLTQAITLCPTELSFYLTRGEYYFRYGCPDACIKDHLAALWQLLSRENPQKREAHRQFYTAMQLELMLAANEPEQRPDRLASVCYSLRDFWSTYPHYWFFLALPSSSEAF